nr:MAG TPA: hypothetical protein [Caudoviricetes sp.]
MAFEKEHFRQRSSRFCLFFRPEELLKPQRLPLEMFVCD